MARVHIYHEDAREIAREVPLESVALETPEALAAAMPEIEVLFAAMPPRTGWRRATKLRLVQMMGTGVDQLLPSPDLPTTVSIAGARGVFADEAAEHAIAMMLALVRALPTTILRQRDRVWRQFEVEKISGKTVTIVGLGEIGRRVARICEAMGMNVLGVSRSKPNPGAFASANFLVVCAPLTDTTRGMIGARELAMLPDLARVISLGRGGIVDESALLEALESGKIGGAALDVFDSEPLPPDSPWWTAPNTIVTPHIAGSGRDYIRRCIPILVDNVRRLERGESLVNLVDRTAGSCSRSQRCPCPARNSSPA